MPCLALFAAFVFLMPTRNARSSQTLNTHSNQVSSNQSLRCRETEFLGQRQTARKTPELKARRSGDKTYSRNPANSGLIAESREISGRPKMRGGPGRTRTCRRNQRLRAKVRQLSTFEGERRIFSACRTHSTWRKRFAYAEANDGRRILAELSTHDEIAEDECRSTRRAAAAPLKTTGD